MLETRRSVAWFVALAFESAMLGCGGSLTTPDATGGNGGSSSSSTSGPGSTVGVGTGGITTGSSTTVGTTTTGVTTTGPTTTTATTGTGTTTTGGTGGTGACGGFGCCDPTKWPGLAPVPIASPNCSDFDSASGPTGVYCVMPGGVWDVDVDGAGTPKLESYRIEPCGTTGRGFHFVGRGHAVWGADAAAAIMSQTQPVDVSAYSGMSFVMKSTTANSLIFKVQNSYSQPQCGKCDDIVIGTECYSGYIKFVQLPANDATPIVVRFADLAQQGWGYKAPGSAMFNPRDLISVAFAFDKNVDFDVCIDDIKFVP